MTDPVQFAITQLRALRWALTAAGIVDPEIVHDYLLGIETGLRGDPTLPHVEPHVPGPTRMNA